MPIVLFAFVSNDIRKALAIICPNDRGTQFMFNGVTDSN